MKRLFSPSLAVLSFALVLSRSWDVGYRLISLETLLALGASLLLAIVLSALTVKSGALRMAGVGVLFLSLIINFIPIFWLAVMVIVVGPVVMGLLHKRLQPHFFLVFALVFVGAKYAKDLQQEEDGFQRGAPSLPSDSDTQILVHWVMDEMGSFDSLPEPYRVKTEIDEIRSAYEQRGFRLYSRAPSVSPDSNVSLGALVNIDAFHQGKTNVEKVAKGTFKVLDNSLHRHYVEKGWNVSITQSSYLDFCSEKNFTCSTYKIGRNAHMFSDAGLPWSQRAEIFKREMLGAWSPSPTLPFTVLSRMELLLEQTRSSFGKHYVFGHFLLPHFPWTLSKDCMVNPLTQWRLPYSARSNRVAGERAAAFHAYWQQTYCTHKRVLRMVDVLDSAHPGRVRFLIHGDHGPRIMLGDFPKKGEAQLEDQTRRNLLEPFVATRLEADAEVSATDAQTMQTLVQKLLISEAGVPFYGAAP